MSNAQRVALVAVAALVAAAGFAFARPDAEERRAPAARTGDGAGESAEPGTTTGRAERREPPARPSYSRIRIRDGAPVGGVRTIRTRNGDTVRLAVSADAPGEVHVHGYDELVQVGPGRTARLRFRADLEGVFEIELEGPGTQLAKLAVEP